MDGLFILGTDFLPLFSCLSVFSLSLFNDLSDNTPLSTFPLSPTSSSSCSVSYLCDTEVLSMISRSNNDLLFFVFVSSRRPVAEGQSASASSLPTSIVVSLPTAPPPPPVAQASARPNNSLSNRKPGVLPANLEEMKVFGNPHVPANPSPL